MARIKELESALGGLRQQERGEEVERLLAEAVDVAGVPLVVARVDQDPGSLREMALKLRDRQQGAPAATVLATADGKKATLVAAVTSELVARGVTAPRLLEEAAQAVGGGAGGKDHLAFAGGGTPRALEDALRGIPDRLVALLGS
jgi:alanyl-tRNA synthetase